jgi:hypothetical protein
MIIGRQFQDDCFGIEKWFRRNEFYVFAAMRTLASRDAR